MVSRGVAPPAPLLDIQPRVWTRSYGSPSARLGRSRRVSLKLSWFHHLPLSPRPPQAFTLTLQAPGETEGAEDKEGSPTVLRGRAGWEVWAPRVGTAGLCSPRIASGQGGTGSCSPERPRGLVEVREVPPLCSVQAWDRPHGLRSPHWVGTQDLHPPRPPASRQAPADALARTSPPRGSSWGCGDSESFGFLAPSPASPSFLRIPRRLQKSGPAPSPGRPGRSSLGLPRQPQQAPHQAGGPPPPRPSARSPLQQSSAPPLPPPRGLPAFPTRQSGAPFRAPRGPVRSSPK